MNFLENKNPRINAIRKQTKELLWLLYDDVGLPDVVRLEACRLANILENGNVMLGFWLAVDNTKLGAKVD